MQDQKTPETQSGKEALRNIVLFVLGTIVVIVALKYLTQ